MEKDEMPRLVDPTSDNDDSKMETDSISSREGGKGNLKILNVI